MNQHGAMTDTMSEKGAARCPGPSMADLLHGDHTGAPEVLLRQSYEFLGDDDISFESYTSPAYAAAEHERMWSRVWQWACREEHLPSPGSYVVYDIGDRSALVIRGDDGQIRAFNNFCLHRGTQLKPSMTSGRSLQVRCPFHGWTWSPTGQLVDLPCRWDFPHVTDEAFALPELKVDAWGGFVFVNFDPDAAPLHEYLGVLPEHFATWDLADRYVEAHARKLLPANWKAAMTAFLEAYHVLETHSQAVANTGDANAQYDVFPPHVSRFIHSTASPSPHLTTQPSEQETLERLLARKFPDRADVPVVPDGETARDVYARYVQALFAEAYHRDFSHLSVSETIDSIEYFLFPNMFVFPGLALAMAYRFRPNGTDPDSCWFDLLMLRPKPLDRPAPKPPMPTVLGIEDSYTTVPGLDPSLGQVYDQDTANLAAQTRGFKGSVKRAQTLGNYQEIRARHLHQTVDHYVKL
jgi:phenylpropionate dioxygenase-like ring-hydroxylating dioxygenase large terminal subunit